MKRKEFFTEQNTIIVKDSPAKNRFMILVASDRSQTAMIFDNEDKPSLIKFLEKVIEELKKEK